MKAHDCVHHGHVWLEAHGVLYSRARNRKGKVHVHCQFCTETATVETHGSFTRGNAKEPIGKDIPPQFMKVMERALEAAPDVAVPEPDDNTGPARDS